MVFRHCGDFFSLKVAEGFEDWFSCWTCALNNSHVPQLVIIAIHHLLIHLFKRSKDKERCITDALRYHGQKLFAHPASQSPHC